MLFPQSAEYAMRAVLHIAQSNGSRYVGLTEISEATGAPRSYLAKVLGLLVHGGVLRSTRGPTGGFRLAGGQGEINLQMIVGLFAPIENRRCLLGHGVCGETPRCAVHRLWSPLATGLECFLRTTTIADLSRLSSPGMVGDVIVRDDG